MRRRGTPRSRRTPSCRRRDHARDRGRRLPRLQRERRPAVGADLPADGRGAERAEPREGQRGADRRPARRRRRQDHAASQQTTARVTAKLDLKLETSIKPLPVDSTIIVRPRSALGLKYIEVTRGDSVAGLPRGRHDPARATRRRARSSSTSSSTCSTSRRASANQQNLRGFGDAFAGRGDDLNAAIQRSSRWSRTRCRC